MKVAATLVRLLINDNRRDKAQVLLRSSISSFPSGNESSGLRTASHIERITAFAITRNIGLTGVCFSPPGGQIQRPHIGGGKTGEEQPAG
jgi:hypothetical protein